ncbi:MAG TPA: M20 aminoacylase family protein [Bradyrhizobium sp.]|nr:M20 aminoacylase family protein [Bradyrhizobium sp.]
MPIVNRVADLQPDIQAWRRDIHQHPELLYDVHRTAAFVADRLREFGCDEVVTGIGKTGVVGVIKGKKPANGGLKVIGLRADMDALPIEEETNLPYASKTSGKMHACGHDGHTAMLLGAARYLAETRNFAGTAVVIFQPAEEGGAGAAAMIKDGLMDRFGIEQVYGMHNGPGIPIGQFAIRTGPIMAATDAVDIKIEGLGGHAARPHKCIDSVLVGAQVIAGLQSIVSRTVDPLESAVISICEFHAGNARNVIPQTAELRGTIRTLTEEVRSLVEQRVREVVKGVAQMTGAKIDLVYERGYPVTVNHAAQTEVATRVAKEVGGEGAVGETPPMMGAEDFAYMLEARPGAFIFCGNGNSAGLHHPAYNFNDEAIVYGTSYWIRLVENSLAA